MSYTTIYKVTPGVSAEEFGELRNAWGSAPLVWDALFKRYVPPKHEYDNWMFDSDRLWKLWDREDIPLHTRAVLGMTFDRSYVERQHFRRAAVDIRKFLEEVPTSEHRVNHWPAIAALMEEHADDESFPALGFNQTSVSESLWRGPYNEEKDDYDPIEWPRFWSLYAEFEAEPLARGALASSASPVNPASTDDGLMNKDTPASQVPQGQDSGAETSEGGTSHE